MKLKLLLLLSLTIAIGCFANATTTPVDDGTVLASKNDIAGSVYHNESKKPLGNVTVTAYLISKKEKIAITNDRGSYAFDTLKPGTYKFVFEKDGYKKVTKDKVVIRTDEGFELNIEMTEHAQFDFMPGPSHFFDLGLEK